MKKRFIAFGLGFALFLLCESCVASPETISAQNAAMLSPIQEWKMYHVSAIAWSPNGSGFAATGAMEEYDDELPDLVSYQIGDAETQWVSPAYGAQSLAYHPDGRTIFVPELFGGAGVFDASTGQLIKTIVDPVMEKGQCIGSLQAGYGSGGATILTMDSDVKFGRSTSVFVWDAITDQCFEKLMDTPGSSFDFDLSRNGELMALMLREVDYLNDDESKYNGLQVQLWNIRTEKQLCVFPGGNAAIDPNGEVVAIADPTSDGNVNLWDAKSCDFLFSLDRKGSDFSHLIKLAISPDGTLLAVGGVDTVQLWELSSRKLLFESEKLENKVFILTFSPDGRFLLSATDSYGLNGIIRLWGVQQ